MLGLETELNVCFAVLGPHASQSNQLGVLGGKASLDKKLCRVEVVGQLLFLNHLL